MRVSVNKDDLGFTAWQQSLMRGETTLVFLDGVEQSHCVAADEELGFVVRLKHDADGQIVTDGDDIIHEEITGKVEVRLEKRG